MKIALASDHAGYKLKEHLKTVLKQKGVTVEDFGTDGEASVDYTDFGRPAAKSVVSGANDRGVLICGTGLGMSLTANRIKGIRGTLCHDEFTTEMARRHNDSNVLILGARVLTEKEAEKLLNIWLETPYEGGRHQRRLDKIEEDC